MREPATSTDELRVLVVDDEINIAELLLMALRYEGFAAETAGSGEEALERFDDFRPHLLVLDVMLPDLDGFEVARRLAASAAGLPIIFLTARDTTEDKVRGLTARRRRLHDQAVQRRGADRSDPGDPAPNRRRRRRGECSAFEDLELDEETREVWRGERADRARPTPSFAYCAT